MGSIRRAGMARFAVAMMLAGCTGGGGSGTPCLSDRDCKGDRICDNATHECVSPPGRDAGPGEDAAPRIDGGQSDAGALDAIGEDATAEDALALDGAGTDAITAEAGAADAIPQDGAGPDATAQDAAVQDATPQDAAAQDAAAQDAAAQDAAGPDAAGPDAAAQDATAQDATAQDGAPQDGAPQDAAPPDAIGQDAAPADAIAPDANAADAAPSDGPVIVQGYLVQGVPAISELAVYNQNLYWYGYYYPTSTSEFGITPVNGGPTGGPLTQQSVLPDTFNFDSTSVYWANDPVYYSGGTTTTSGSLRAMPLAGGTIPTVLTPPTEGISGLALQNGILYFGTSNGIRSMPTSGGPSSPVVSDTYVYAIRSDATALYFRRYDANANRDTVRRAPLSGGVATTIASANLTSPAWKGLVLSGNTLFWNESGMIRSTPIQGGATATIAPGRTDIRFMGVDEPWLYWGECTNCLVNHVSFSVYRMPTAGGPVEMVYQLPSQQIGRRIAFDATSLYIAVLDTTVSNPNPQTAGAIYKMPKPP